MPTTSDRLLEIYLADHLAASTAGLELARRSARSNAGNATGEFLRRLVIEVEEDRETLKRVIAELGFKPSRSKETAAWVLEKVGRLKLNGQVRGYSPLSRVLELESLAVGIAGKEALWRALQRVATVETVDLQGLVERARRQRADAEEHRIAAVDEALR